MERRTCRKREGEGERDGLRMEERSEYRSKGGRKTEEVKVISEDMESKTLVTYKYVPSSLASVMHLSSPTSFYTRLPPSSSSSSSYLFLRLYILLKRLYIATSSAFLLPTLSFLLLLLLLLPFPSPSLPF